MSASDSLEVTVPPPLLRSAYQFVEGDGWRWRPLFLLWWARPRPWSAEAGIAGVVDTVILAVGVHVLGVVLVVLHDRQGSDQVRAGREHDQHGIALEVASEP